MEMIAEKTVKRLNELIDQNRERILKAADFIWKNPETGYREWKTSKFMDEQFKELGYKTIHFDGVPGFYADIDTGRPGPSLAIMGELDSVICASHPEADPETGAVHACGHHTQCAYLVGVAGILKDPQILETLSGKIRLIAVPAEELLELEFRASLRDKGTIKYFGGKVEFLYRGVFDGMSAAIMSHSGGSISEKPLVLYKGNNGCITKTITFKGKAAHAGGGPHRAINALYAATLGINAINAIRETLKEENYTRIHPIITDGGVAVNVIPETAKLESYVRGANPEAMVAENKKVNRALAGAALSIGAGLRIQDIPGYMPLHNSLDLNETSKKVGDVIFGEDNVEINTEWKAGSTDMGDLSCVLPVVHAGGGGGEGTGHGNDYRIIKAETACVDSAKYICALACALLGSGGAELKRIKDNYKPVFASYKEYFDFVDKIYSEKELVKYDGDSAAIIW
ncbi:MAG: amidohydrolase [Treponema sp.]|nr:amidohydrolase [Treponema sp.]